MSFGNGNVSGNIDIPSGYTDTGFGNFGDSVYGNTGFENVPIQGLPSDSNGYQVLDMFKGVLGKNENDGSVKGNWFNTLGRLGTGLLGALGDYDASANQQSYIPYTQWLGNGLAKFSAINNTMNKQQQKNNAYGNTLMLSSLFGPGKSLLGSLGGQIGRNYGGGIYNDSWGNDSTYRNIEPRYTTGGVEWRDEKDVTI